MNSMADDLGKQDDDRKSIRNLAEQQNPPKVVLGWQNNRLSVDSETIAKRLETQNDGPTGSEYSYQSDVKRIDNFGPGSSSFVSSATQIIR